MNHTIAATPAEDEKFMKDALKQARKACRLQETPIGCVIVRTHDYDGNPITPKIIARGYNRRNTDKNPLSHAEIIAIKRPRRSWGTGGWRAVPCT